MNKASHGEIAQRAYAIWEREGRPHGRDYDHWLKAEREIETDQPTAPNRQPSEGATTVRRKATRSVPPKPKKMPS